jgi:hypothetical protein
MPDNRSMTGRYTGLFLLGCFLFCYPVLTIFNLPSRLFGIPLFFFYIFAAWTVLIILIIFCGKIPDTALLSEPDIPGNNLKQPD